MNKQETLSIIQHQGILPLFYHDNIEVCTGVIDALYEAGIRAVEFTNRGANAIINFKQLTKLAATRWQGLQAGIGTILNVADAQAFTHAGAAFVVCPGVLPAVAETVSQAGVLWIPGCLTATEIIVAKEHGAKLIKIFPGSLVGPSYITAIKEIFTDLLFMPTGGVEVSESSIGSWFKAGVCAVGLGSKVISKEMLANKDYEAIKGMVTTAMTIVQKVK